MGLISIPIISFLAGSYAAYGYLGPFSLIAALIKDPSQIPLTTYLINFVITTVVYFIGLKLLGKIGGIILMVLGIIGAFFTLGTTLVLTLLGLIMVMAGGAVKWVLIINAIIFGIAIFSYAI